MATRNRTTAYVGFRKKGGNPNDIPMVELGHRPLIGAPGGGLAAGLTLGPAWLSLKEDVRIKIDGIKERMTELRDLQTRHLRVGFETNVDEERRIEALTGAITSSFQQSYELVKRLHEGDRLESEEDNIKLNMQKALAREVQELSIVFRKEQREYLRKMQGQSALGGSNVFQTPSAPEEEYDAGFTDPQLALLATHEAVIDQRDAEIRQVAQSLVELSDIFKELAMLVVDQGTILDRIDYNIETVEYETQQAVVNLQATEKLARGATSKLMFLLLLIAVLVLIVILVAKGFLRAVLG